MASTRLRRPPPQLCSVAEAGKVSISPNHLSTCIFSRSPAPGGPSKPRPKNKFGKELYSRRRIPAFTNSPLPQNTSDPAGETVAVAEAKTDQQKANTPCRQKRRARKTLTAIPPANETIAQINRLICGEEGGEALRHFDPARAQQDSGSRVLVDLNPSPLTRHFHHLDLTSSLTQPPHPQPSPTHGHPQPPHNSTLHNPHQRPPRSKPWPTRKEIKMASQYVPPHLRVGHNRNPPPTRAAEGEAAGASADQIRLALRGHSTAGGSSRVNQHSPYVFNVRPSIHVSPFSFSSFHPVLTLA
jgi:hypothetical protein